MRPYFFICGQAWLRSPAWVEAYVTIAQAQAYTSEFSYDGWGEKHNTFCISVDLVARTARLEYLHMGKGAYAFVAVPWGAPRSASAKCFAYLDRKLLLTSPGTPPDEDTLQIDVQDLSASTLLKHCLSGQ